LAALRAQPRNSAEGASFRVALDKTRARILQILQLDRENEQLLLALQPGRCQRRRGRVCVASPSPSILQKIYQRH